MKTLILLFFACSLFGQTKDLAPRVPPIYTTLPSPCGTAGGTAQRQVGTGSSAKLYPNTCQGDGTWVETGNPASIGCANEGYWDSAKTYPLGSDTCGLVFYGAAGNAYQTLASSNNVIPGSETANPPVYWRQVGYIIPFTTAGVFNSASSLAPLSIVTYQGSSYYSLAALTAPVTAPPSCSTYPSGNSSWGVLACGSGAVASYGLACTPSSVTVTQGAGANYTCTVTAQSGFSGTISFSGASLPSGGTMSFSPSTLTVSSTTPVTTTATLATASIAQGTYSGIQVSSTSGGQTVLASSTNSVTVTAPGFLTLSHSTYTSPVNLTTVGTDDWGTLNPPDNSNSNTMPFTFRKSGGAILGSTIAMSPTGDRFYPGTNTSNFTWTNAGGGTASGSTSGSTQYISASRSYVFTAAADLTPRTLYFYFSYGDGAPSTTASVTATISGSGAPTAPTMSWTVDTTGTGGGVNGGFNMVTIQYQAAAAGQTLTVTMPNNVNAGLTAIAVTH